MSKTKNMLENLKNNQNRRLKFYQNRCFFIFIFFLFATNLAIPATSLADTYVFETATSTTTWDVPAGVTSKVWGTSGGGGGTE
jgi:hypothetical protein